ncbi:hypothetical protein H0G86_013060 [Trichoderma simmonsii]|uniref:Uncharacterized protein n=1 Tax=Trichoderma simmonsii TaxID=1491479 RepID=A0A8G0LSK0_9HYPO|nr:hypothetical protein H0G86_013060 [Trichoderma simmonsii]
MSEGELVYHHACGHYHRRDLSNRDRHRPRRENWSAMKFWDEVLYSIGDFYYKVRRG